MLSRIMTRKEQWVLMGLASAIALGAVSIFVHRSMQGSGEESVSPTPKVEVVVKHETVPAPIDIESLPIVSEVAVPAPAAAARTRIQVSVVGAVDQPGLYEMRQDDRVQDLIDQAGGVRDDADLTDINLAARLIDESTLTIPTDPTAGKRDGQAVIRNRRPIRVQNPPQYTLSGWQPPAPTPAASAAGTATPSTAARTGANSGGRIDINRASEAELETLPGIGPKKAADIVRFRSTTPFKTVDDLINVSGIGPKTLESVRPLVTVGAAN